jgi:hypothetical protein
VDFGAAVVFQWGGLFKQLLGKSERLHQVNYPKKMSITSSSSSEVEVSVASSSEDEYVEYTDGMTAKAAALMHAQTLEVEAIKRRRRHPCAAWMGGLFGMGLIIFAIILTSPKSPFHHSSASASQSTVVEAPQCWIDTSNTPFLVNLASDALPGDAKCAATFPEAHLLEVLGIHHHQDGSPFIFEAPDQVNNVTAVTHSKLALTIGLFKQLDLANGTCSEILSILTCQEK